MGCERELRAYPRCYAPVRAATRGRPKIGLEPSILSYGPSVFFSKGKIQSLPSRIWMSLI
jgi:hypothetical protein